MIALTLLNLNIFFICILMPYLSKYGSPATMQKHTNTITACQSGGVLGIRKFKGSL